MYKVTITKLKSFKKALEESNVLLRKLYEESDDTNSANVLKVIKHNEEQIKILTNQFYINETND